MHPLSSRAMFGADKGTHLNNTNYMIRIIEMHPLSSRAMFGHGQVGLTRVPDMDRKTSHLTGVIKQKML